MENAFTFLVDSTNCTLVLVVMIVIHDWEREVTTTTTTRMSDMFLIVVVVIAAHDRGGNWQQRRGWWQCQICCSSSWSSFAIKSRNWRRRISKYKLVWLISVVQFACSSLLALTQYLLISTITAMHRNGEHLVTTIESWWEIGEETNLPDTQNLLNILQEATAVEPTETSRATVLQVN
jgi:hypothetical protein